MDTEDPDDVPVRLTKPEHVQAEKLAKKLSELVLYTVMNNEGRFFRAKGYGGYGETWTDDPKKAKIYAKISPARATISFFANRWPKYPTPALVEIRPGSIKILDETERVAKVKSAKVREIAAREERYRQRELKRAQEELEKAQERLKKVAAKSSANKGRIYINKQTLLMVRWGQDENSPGGWYGWNGKDYTTTTPIIGTNQITLQNGWHDPPKIQLQ